MLRKEISESMLEDSWGDLGVAKTYPEKTLKKMKEVYQDLFKECFSKEVKPSQDNCDFFGTSKTF